eukprot:7337808-Prymnesium_polylepis.3
MEQTSHRLDGGVWPARCVARAQTSSYLATSSSHGITISVSYPSSTRTNSSGSHLRTRSSSSAFAHMNPCHRSPRPRASKRKPCAAADARNDARYATSSVAT